MKDLITLLLFLSVIIKCSFAQDISFSQPHNNALYLNPAFAGAFINPTFTASYRDEFPAYGGGYKTGFFEYSQYVNALHGGIGGYAIYDGGYEDRFKTEVVKLIYSYRIEIGNTVIQPAFGAGYTNKNDDYIFYTVPPTEDHNSKGFYDYNAGLLVYSKYLYGGFAIDHLTQPDQSVLVNEPEVLPIKYTLHTGANIPITSSIGSVYISPNIIYSKQDDFHTFISGLTIKVKYALIGIAYRVSQQSDSYLTFSAGFQNSFLRISYSYEKATDFFSNTNNYTHEVSVSYTLKNKKQQNRPALQMIAF